MDVIYMKPHGQIRLTVITASDGLKVILGLGLNSKISPSEEVKATIKQRVLRSCAGFQGFAERSRFRLTKLKLAVIRHSLSAQPLLEKLFRSQAANEGPLEVSGKMSSADEEITRLYKIRKTLTEMLKDRKYLVADSDLRMTRQEFIAKCQENVRRGDSISFSHAKENDSSDQIYVYFPSDPKSGMPVIKTLVERMKQGGFSRAILVVQNKLTPSAKTCINSLLGAKFHVEVFQEEELLVNISKHALVPPHEVLTDEEKKSLLVKYAVKETQLPRIQVTDPIARYHGMKRGQVVKITRDSETAGKYITYRYCC